MKMQPKLEQQATSLAPIGVSTYVRLQHLQQTIEALQKNVLAQQSQLFVFSDAPRAGDEERVAAVRSYLRTIGGFKEIHVVEREINNRTANNRGGIRMLLEQFGKVIFLEDDVIALPGFLLFMNEALEFYKDDPRIGSISGYCPPIEIPQEYSKDVFALTRFVGWGLGLWKRYYKMDTPISEHAFKKVFNDKKKLKDLVRSLGEEASHIIRMDFKGELDAGDMKTMFWQFMDNKLTIYPRKTLTENIGQDGSGFHMPVTNKWDVSDIWDKVSGFEFSQVIEVDERILKAHSKFYEIKRGPVSIIIKLLKIIGIYKYIRPIARRIRTWWQM